MDAWNRATSIDIVVFVRQWISHISNQLIHRVDILHLAMAMGSFSFLLSLSGHVYLFNSNSVCRRGVSDARGGVAHSFGN